MAWVTTTYVDAFIGQGQRVALFGTTAVFDQFEIGARATVQLSTESPRNSSRSLLSDA